MFLGDFQKAIEYFIEKGFDGNKYALCINSITAIYDGYLFTTDTHDYLVYRVSGRIIKMGKGSWKNETPLEIIFEGVTA